MLIVALVLAVISLAALVTAVVTSSELIAWACIGFSALGVLLLIVDAIRDRNRRPVLSRAALAAETTEVMAPIGVLEDVEDVEDYPDELVYDDPEHDEPSDDEPDYPIAAEEAAIHTITDEELVAQAYSDEVESNVETSIDEDDSGSYVVTYSGEPSTDESSTSVDDEPSYIVTESPADDSATVIDPDEEHDGER